MPPTLSVIICSLNGAEGVDRCLRALEQQTIRSELEFIVVDDGSTDSTSDVARAHETNVIRHHECRGISAARNSGAGEATAHLVAFLDDDCEPYPDWAERVVANFQEDILALGGALTVPAESGIMLSYLRRNNPLDPQELELASSQRLAYRLWLYLKRQWVAPRNQQRRQVFSFAGANMALQREVLNAVGGFDERIRFGADDDDLLQRLRLAVPGKPLVFDPAVIATHYFKPSLRDTLRRSRAYGRGRAMMCRKWSSTRPTFFPFPLLIFLLIIGACRLPYLAVVAIVLPQILYPRGISAAFRGSGPLCLFDPYIQLAQEACGNFGFVQGWLRFRKVPPEPESSDATECDASQLGSIRARG